MSAPVQSRPPSLTSSLDAWSGLSGRSAAQALFVPRLLAGEVELTFASAGAAAAPIKSNRLRALAVTTAKPSVLFPGLPTIADSGLPGFESVLVNGMFAPAGTPASIINRLSREVAQILRRAEVRERYFHTGMETVGTSPEEFQSIVKSEMAKWGKLIKAVKIRGD